MIEPKTCRPGLVITSQIVIMVTLEIPQRPQKMHNKAKPKTKQSIVRSDRCQLEVGWCVCGRACAHMGPASMWWIQVISLRAIFSTKCVGHSTKYFYQICRNKLGVEIMVRLNIVCYVAQFSRTCLDHLFRQNCCYVSIVFFACSQFLIYSKGFSRNDFCILSNALSVVWARHSSGDLVG